jgi:anti-anti-sigma regulatory factor
MLKITEVNQTKDEMTLKLEGRVVGPWVQAIRESCDQALLKSNRLMVDMSEVSFIERDAISLFRELQSRNVVFINCSPFLSEQLKGITSY